ncbi:MAG: NADH-quinone oxidoreductase subunit L, partial [Pseudomonadota bacterium]
FRALFMVFFGESRTAAGSGTPHDSPSASVWGPLWLLAALSICGGWIGSPWFPAINFFSQWLAPVTEPGRVLIAERFAREAITTAHHSHVFEYAFVAISVFAALAGIGMAWLFYVRRRDLPDRWAINLGPVYRLLRDRYRVDELYGFLFVRPLMQFSETVLWKVCDVLLIDGAVNGVARLAVWLGAFARRMQTGFAQHYALAMLAGMTLLIIYFMAFE